MTRAAVLALLGGLLGALPAWGETARPAPPIEAQKGVTPSMMPFLDLAWCLGWEAALSELKGKREMFAKQVDNPELSQQIETYFALGPCARRPKP